MINHLITIFFILTEFGRKRTYLFRFSSSSFLNASVFAGTTERLAKVSVSWTRQVLHFTIIAQFRSMALIYMFLWFEYNSDVSWALQNRKQPQLIKSWMFHSRFQVTRNWIFTLHKQPSLSRSSISSSFNHKRCQPVTELFLMKLYSYPPKIQFVVNIFTGHPYLHLQLPFFKLK